MHALLIFLFRSLINELLLPFRGMYLFNVIVGLTHFLHRFFFPLLFMAIKDGAAKVEVFAAVKLTGYTLDTFKAREQTAFKIGIANIYNIKVAEVKIINITTSTARRQLLAAGIDVDFSIEVTDITSAATLSKTVANTIPTAMTAIFRSSGLTSIQSVTVLRAPSIATPAPATAP